MVFRLLSVAKSLLVRPSIGFSVAVVMGAALLAYLLISTPEASSPSALQAAQVKQRPAAVDLVGGTDWLNTDKPITLADLKGRIVLLDFWTLCCINCIHTLPDLAKLEAKYPGMLVVIGVHSPKFEHEKKTEAIRKAVLKYEIKHPIINDADHKVWKRFRVNAWPTLVVIDPDGNIVARGSGEGLHEALDKLLGELVKEYRAKK